MATVHFTDAELNTMLFAIARQEYRLLECHSVANALALLMRSMHSEKADHADADAQRLKTEIDVCRNAREKINVALSREPARAA